jgi:hypothetical protein
MLMRAVIGVGVLVMAMTGVAEHAAALSGPGWVKNAIREQRAQQPKPPAQHAPGDGGKAAKAKEATGGGGFEASTPTGGGGFDDRSGGLLADGQQTTR